MREREQKMVTNDEEVNGEDVNVDKILRSLKKAGKYQLWQMFLLIANWFNQGMNILSFVFIGFIPEYQCRPYANSSEWPQDLRRVMEATDRNLSLEYGECHVNIFEYGHATSNISFPCTNGYLYSRPKELSFITEWDLVCDKAALGAFSQTLLTIGMGAGAAIVPLFADRFGRKPALIFCMLGIWAASLALGFSPSYNIFMLLRFFTGFFQQGISISDMAMALELFPTEHRAFISMLCGMGWCIGCMMLTPVAYFFRNQKWQIISFAISCFSSVAILDVFFLRESLRWLFAKNRVSDAKIIVRQAAKTNGVNFDEIWRDCVTIHALELDTITNHHYQHQQQQNIQQQSENDNQEKDAFPQTESMDVDDDKKTEIPGNIPLMASEEKKVSIAGEPKKQESALNLLTSRVLRFIMFIQIYTWFINALTYYGLYLTSSSLAGNKFLNFFLTALSELLSVIVMWKSFIWIGRKKTLVMFLSIAICSLLTSTAVSILIDKESKFFIISTAAAMIGMFGISGSFNGLWGYLPELIPTKYRSAALGLASSAARVGSAMSPFTAFLIRFIAWGPGVIFSAGCLLANFLIMMLPETCGRQLPQNISDVKSWMKKSPKKVTKAGSYSKITQEEENV